MSKLLGNVKSILVVEDGSAVLTMFSAMRWTVSNLVPRCPRALHARLNREEKPSDNGIKTVRAVCYGGNVSRANQNSDLMFGEQF